MKDLPVRPAAATRGPPETDLPAPGGASEPIDPEAAWRALLQELAIWGQAGQVATFWWRDDDAGAPSAALDRLFELAGRHRVPLALAAIPMDLQASALRQAGEGVHVLQHGVDHRNRAEAGGKKTEFAASEPLAQALERLRQGLARLRAVAPGRTMPVLVPPWNRIAAPDLAAALPDAGLRGLSRFGPRGPLRLPVREFNTHVDLIAWRGDRGFAGDAACIGQALSHLRARRLGLADPDEPTGWLSHHAVHDAATWAFIDRLLRTCAGRTDVRWVLPPF